MLFWTYFYHPCSFKTRQTYRNHHSTYSYSGIGSIERALSCRYYAPINVKSQDGGGGGGSRARGKDFDIFWKNASNSPPTWQHNWPKVSKAPTMGRFPSLLHYPRWWPCQIPHPGNMSHDQNPHPGDRPHSQSSPSLGLNIDKGIIGPDPDVSYINLFLIINFVNLTWIQWML